MDGGTAEDETAGSAAHDGASDGLVNSDLHGAAREVAEGASGDGAAKTPGA